MSGDVEAPRPRPLSGGLWSLLSWLRRDDPSLSIESLSSIGSDRTTASFAFLTPEHYRVGNKPTVLPPPGPPTDSYKRRVHDRNLRFKYDHNITLHRKYGLHKSQESVGYDTFSLPPYNKSDALIKNGRDRRATSEGFHRRTVHVPGKRRAPLPPIRASSLGPSTTLTRKSRKRPAPLPPSLEFTPKTKENQKLYFEVPMNTSHHDIKSLKTNGNLMEAKPQKFTKIDNNTKETKLRSEKNFLKHIFENKKRHSVETASLRLLPSISELDKQAAEIIKNDRLKFSHADKPVAEASNQIPSDEMWICTKCFKKYKASIPICLNCTTQKRDKNEQCISLEGTKNSNTSASDIYTQTDNELKLSCSKINKANEKQKLKEMLKEMKDSLPKKINEPDNVVLINNYTESKEKKETKIEDSIPTLRIGFNEKDINISKLQTLQETYKGPQVEQPPILKKTLLVASENVAQTMSINKQINNAESHVIPKIKETNFNNIEIQNNGFDLNTPLKISLLLNPMNDTKSENSSVVTSRQTQNNNIFKSTQVVKVMGISNDSVKNDVKSPAISYHASAATEANTKNEINSPRVKSMKPKTISHDSATSNTKSSCSLNEPTVQKNIPESNGKKIESSQTIIKSIPSTSTGASTSIGNTKEDTHVQSINHHLKRRELINQLEKSIANGDEQSAAEAAVKLAQLRLSCSVLSFSSQIASEFKNGNVKCKDVSNIPIDNKTDVQEQPKRNNIPHESKSTTPNTKTFKEKQLPTVNVSIQNTENKKKVNENPVVSAVVPSDENKVKINVWVEDREATRGPINLSIGRRDVLADLRREAERSFGLPTNLQRWIIGRTLCSEDNTPLFTLAGPELKAPFYLCLVKSDKTTSTISKILNKKNLETSTLSLEAKTKTVNVYNELMQLEQQSLIVNTETFECGVCIEECAPGNGVILRECVHSFCRECLSDVVRHSEEPDVSCPAMGCRGLLQEREIRTLVSSEDYEKWLARGLAAAENGTRNSFHCRTRDCSGWALCEPGVQYFPCPVCKKINCVPCQSIHEGETCEQHRAKLEAVSNSNPNQTDDSTRALLLNLIKKGEALECPECKAIITKKWGCDWIKCSACKTEICWVTRGRRWGPSGRGDTSAGCRCGVDGKRCHPSCGYCH